MKLLLDTHLLLWAALGSPKLKSEARRLIDDSENEVWFSAASIWEIAIKNRVARSGFNVDPLIFRQGLIDASYAELNITSLHAAATQSLPMIHSDPFDRLLVAQAHCEGAMLLTSDKNVAAYPGPMRLV